MYGTWPTACKTISVYVRGPGLSQGPAGGYIPRVNGLKSGWDAYIYIDTTPGLCFQTTCSCLVPRTHAGLIPPGPEASKLTRDIHLAPEKATHKLLVVYEYHKGLLFRTWVLPVSFFSTRFLHNGKVKVACAEQTAFTNIWRRAFRK